jgi:hypothetical protein
MGTSFTTAPLHTIAYVDRASLVPLAPSSVSSGSSFGNNILDSASAAQRLVAPLVAAVALVLAAFPAQAFGLPGQDVHCLVSSYGGSPSIGFTPTKTSTCPNGIAQWTIRPPWVAIPLAFRSAMSLGPSKLAPMGLSPEVTYTPVINCPNGSLTPESPQECTSYGVWMPALWRVSASCAASRLPSASVGYTIRETGTSENGLMWLAISTRCRSVSVLGETSFSSSMFLPCRSPSSLFDSISADTWNKSSKDRLTVRITKPTPATESDLRNPFCRAYAKSPSNPRCLRNSSIFLRSSFSSRITPRITPMLAMATNESIISIGYAPSSGNDTEYGHSHHVARARLLRFEYWGILTTIFVAILYIPVRLLAGDVLSMWSRRKHR